MNLVKWSAASLSSIVILSACQGQNPFKRESNPLRDYPKVADSIQKHEGAVPYNSKPSASGNGDNGTTVCAAPFVITSNSPDNHTLFTFEVDSAKAFEILIVNRLGDSFEVAFKNLPPGMEAPKVLSTPTVKSAIYQISWSPKNEILVNDSAFRSSIALTFKSKALSERCPGAVGTESLNLMVQKVDGRPKVAITMPPTIKFGAEAKILIEVTDEAATTGKAPTLNGFTFTPPAQNKDTIKVIDGSRSISNCDIKPKFRNGKWQFTCVFLSNALGTNEHGLVDSGQTGRAIFGVSATSVSSGKTSHVTEGSVKVKFDKIPAANATSQGQKQ